MKHQHDDRQCSLFDEPPPEKPAADEPPSLQPFESALLEIIEHEGEPRVTATSACKAMHYGEVIHLREFIRRLDKAEDWGPLSYRTMMVRIGSGARRAIDEPLLTEKQFTIVCMRSNQPNMAALRSLIADVFIAWRHGKLRAADAETEVKLQEATDGAIDAMPDLLAFCAQFSAEQRLIRKAVEETRANRRRDPSAETVRIGRWVVKFNYLDRCPCCRRVIIGPDYKHSHWGHMKGHSRNGVRDGWPICEKCNQDWEDSKNTKEISISFVGYLDHVEAYLAQGQFTFGRKA